MNRDLTKNSHLIISGYWILILGVFIIQVYPQTNSFSETLLFSFCITISIYPVSTWLSGSLLMQALNEKRLVQFGIFFIMLSIIVAGIFMLYLHLFSYLESEQYFPPSEYFNIVSEPWLATYSVLSAGMFINLCICGLRFLIEYIKSQKSLHEYQLQSLKHQVTPHFMFNVLNHIHVLMQENVDHASDLLIQYSDILRYQLYKGNQETVKVKEEVDFLKSFIEVEKLRWEEKVRVSTAWSIQNHAQEIPALLFIIFIENAFKYVRKDASNPGCIDIQLSTSDEKIDFQIQNSANTVQIQSTESTGLGLKNIKGRLEILFPKRHILSIHKSDTDFRLRLTINLR
ncbi:sensor histidine kinase [Fulvivirga sediminis]|uniref:Histidine kinase n=1 Tax=Fulvivirga sediminis TaxID=2803949 RepID=A0A937F906_9BACT|nr:histidine kinase [Fulvivirga sediminis]MBL3657905.1 histidine kinase [Fulvivirga sediminis]